MLNKYLIIIIFIIIVVIIIIINFHLLLLYDLILNGLSSAKVISGREFLLDHSS